ncbi:MAG: sterol transfer family [Chloroflexi bacterium]|nr:sterol transfer family [Chloroflexota bacterium]
MTRPRGRVGVGPRDQPTVAPAERTSRAPGVTLSASPAPRRAGWRPPRAERHWTRSANRPTLQRMDAVPSLILEPGRPAPPRGPFDPLVLAADIRLVATLLGEELGRIGEGRWRHRSGHGNDAWTLHDVVGHMATIAEIVDTTAAAALGETVELPADLPARDGIAAFNRQRVARTRSQPTIITVDRLAGALERSAARAEAMTPADGARQARVPTYGRPIRADEALAVQLTHPVVLHGPQFADAARLERLVEHLGPDVRHRMLERAIQLMTATCDRERAGDLRAVVAFEVGGAGGGTWWLSIAPGTVIAGRGMVDRPTVGFRIANTSVAFCLLAGRLNAPLAMLERQLRVSGDRGLAGRIRALVDPG